MRWTERQQAMLREMGLRLWLPGAPASEPAAEPATAAPAAAAVASEPATEIAPVEARVATVAEAAAHPRLEGQAGRQRITDGDHTGGRAG